ncbi:MAG: hypothetical protein HRT38_03125 [Alteromonadaceae bacterium]|nr:hypothetical protein [Alteromonadaceae bacterium]
MNPIKLITALSTATLLSGCIVVANPINADHHTNKEFNLNKSNLSALIIDAGAGSLIIKGEEGRDEISVIADIYTDSNNPNNFTLSLNKEGNKAVLEAKMKSHTGFWLNGSPHIDLVVKVPKSMMLDITDGSGEIDLRNISAKVVINDGSGDIEINHVIGNLEINDGSGGLYVKNVKGDITVYDGSGEMELIDIEGDLEVDDGSGSIYVKNLDGAASFSDGSGDMTIKEVSGIVTIDDGSGDIDVQGAGGLKLLETGSGGLKVNNVKGNFEIDS